MSSSLLTIALDFYWEGPRPVSTPTVKITLLMEEGPGGGNPLYALTGTREHLTEYLKHISYCDDDELDFYLTPANPHEMKLLAEIEGV